MIEGNGTTNFYDKDILTFLFSVMIREILYTHLLHRA